MKDNVVLITSILLFLFIIYIDSELFEAKGTPFIVCGVVVGCLYFYIKHSKHFD